MLLAKSPANGGTSLRDHTVHVVAVVERMAEALGFDVALARHGAVLHDLGKAHPFFQAKLRGKLDQLTLHLAEPHRHEISSLLLLPLFPDPEWPTLVDMVVAHHKSILGDGRRRGLLDLAGEDYSPRRVFERHSEGWDAWSPEAAEIAASFGVPVKRVTLDEAWCAFEFALDHCERKPDGWSRWRGLLMGADHFASAYGDRAADEAQPLFRVPDLSCYDPAHGRYGASPLYPLSRMSTDDPRPHTLVTAPTGAGKTQFLLRRCRARVSYTLPFQASINAMYLRVVRDLAAADITADVRRLHAASSIDLGDGPDEDPELQRHPGAGIRVMTPHQMASIAFGTAGHELTALDLEGQDVILDEVHTYNGLAQRMVLEVVRRLARLGCRVHVGTATIPTALSELLVEALGGEDAVHRVRLAEDDLRSFDRHIVHKHADEASARSVLTELVNAGQRILFVSNQVRSAQERFRWVRDHFPDVPSMLIHSRYRRMDRASLEWEIGRFDQRDGPCVVCATQVVEVSLDVSFDAMVTDAAPLDALVQRFGRVNRRRSEEAAGRVFKPVHVIAPPDDDRKVLPYGAGPVRASFCLLADGEVLRENSIQEMIDRVYPEVQPPPAGTHLMMVDGRYRIQELQNRPKSILMEALEIDSETGVLASDADVYRTGSWEERLSLEIPLSQSAHRFRDAWGRIDRGSHPFIIPDEHYHPEGLPLGFVEPAKVEPRIESSII
jgi:CRISPR-associated endonuclease/helicase Cas3